MAASDQVYGIGLLGPGLLSPRETANQTFWSLLQSGPPFLVVPLYCPVLLSVPIPILPWRDSFGAPR